MKSIIIFASLLVSAKSQSTIAAWGQCGGEGYAGATECVDGYTCIFVNDWYSHCQPSSVSTFVTSTVSSTPTSSSAPTATARLKWVGVDESGAEWGTTYPGTEGVDYFFPSTTTIGVRMHH